MQTITLIILAMYIIGLFILTHYVSKNESSKDYINASQELGWFSFGFSNFASLLSGYNLIVGITLAVMFGPWYFAGIVGFGFAYIFFYFVYKSVHARKESFFTIVDYFKDRFGPLSAHAINAIYIFLILLFLSLQFFINADLLATITPLTNLQAVLLVAAVVLLYTLYGGFKTVVRTDIFQGLLMLVFTVLIFTGDYSSITYTSLSNDLTNSTFIFTGFALVVLQFLVTGSEPAMWQRLFTVKNTEECKKGFIFSFVLTALALVPLAFIGFAARYNGIDILEINPFTLMEAVSPAWFVPVMSVALFAALMSTLDSLLFAIGTQTIQLWKRNIFSVSVETVKYLRFIMIVSVIIAVVLSFGASSFMQRAFDMASISAIFTSVLLTSWVLRIKNDWEVFIGMLVGMLSFFAIWTSGLITTDLYTALYPSIATAGYLLLQRLVVAVWYHPVFTEYK